MGNPLSVGDKIPEATLSRMGDKGPEGVALSSFTKGKKVAIFGLPGAFTGTCSMAHLPSFMRTAEALKAKGVDHIICISVNDPFVMQAWDQAHGAGTAGIEMLADPASEFTKAAGLAFSVPPIGFVDRCQRISALVDDGEVKIMNVEEQAGVCNISAGETLLDQL